MLNETSSDEQFETIETSDEDTATDPDLETIEEQSSDKIKKMRSDLKQCEQEKMQALEDLQRSKADFLNARRRMEEERASDRTRIEHNFAQELFPLCDSFHIAISNTAVWEQVDENWRKSVEGIYQNLQNILKQHNIESFDPTGEIFDPELHEAISTKDDESVTDTILQVLQLGFKSEETIIRPAKVILSS